VALDILIRGGTVFDGSGASPAKVTVGIAAGRIVSMGAAEAAAAIEIDARERVVAPGFIDIHSHSDYTLLIDPRAVSAVSQGVTTEVIGNCGFGCAPLGDARLAAAAIYGFDASVPLCWRSVGEYLAKLEAASPAVNVTTLVPNGQLRLGTVGLADRAATPIEIQDMRQRLREAMADGAAGYSVGLEYPPEVGCGQDELLALARETARAGGLFATHTRDRGAGAPAAVLEVIRIARDAQVKLQVSHLMPRSGELECRLCLEAVERAREEGQDLAFDMHTRLYGTTMLSTLLPAWSLEDGAEGVRRNLADSRTRTRIKAFRSLISSLNDWERVQLLDVPGRPDISRLTLADVGRRRDRDPHDCALDILADEAETLYRPMVILHAYDERLQQLAFAHPLCAPASDATTLAGDGPLAGNVFHGAYTWASWYWRALVREWKLLKPETAIHRLTGLPASILGLTDRGILKVGAHADIAVFDPATFGERGTTFEPNQLAVGMQHVLVNGVQTLREGVRTGHRAGKVLRRQGPRVYS
jgi:N-acyl-D-amino-acid deacylase